MCKTTLKIKKRPGYPGPFYLCQHTNGFTLMKNCYNLAVIGFNMVRYCLLLINLILPSLVFCQLQLKGMVLGEEKKPVPKASIFLNNTSIGTASKDDGHFELSIPTGKFELIVSSVGYETFSQVISASSPSFITIQLTPKIPILETVVVEPFEKNGWEKWGRFFIENFIGTTSYARDCKLKNPGVLRFKHSKKNNELTVVALEPLIIENRALGFTVQYQMETFTYNFRSRYLVYAGYPFFKPMSGGTAKQKKWNSNRKEVYYGSMMHFMRSVYRNDILENGFEVRPLQKVVNAEKQRVKAIYPSKILYDGNLKLNLPKDSSEYYSSVMAQPDQFDVAGGIISGDGIAYAVDDFNAGMDFPHYLMVTYKPRVAPVEYRKLFPQNSHAMMSQITLVNGRPIEIQANGMYYNPMELLSLGYWSWSEKMAAMLPLDYWPTSDKPK